MTDPAAETLADLTELEILRHELEQAEAKLFGQLWARRCNPHLDRRYDVLIVKLRQTMELAGRVHELETERRLNDGSG